MVLIQNNVVICLVQNIKEQACLNNVDLKHQIPTFRIIFHDELGISGNGRLTGLNLAGH